MPDEPHPNMQTIYQVASQQWGHAEQIRWTLLYNYLMASTILLLGWATVFTCGHPGRLFALIVLGFAGFLLSLLWIALGKRSSGFVQSYSEFGQGLECGGESPIGAGAFNAAKKHREEITGIASLATSRRVLFVVPLIFAIVFFSFTIIPVLIWCGVIA